MTRSELFFIRHGETEWNRAGRYVGSTDLPISERGREQAERLAHNFTLPDGARLFTSPKRRARMTADLVAPGCGIEVVEKLRELSFGQWEGLTSEQIEEKWPGQLAQMWGWNRDFTLPDGDNLGEFEERVGAVVKYLLNSSDECAVAFCHGGLIRLILCHLLNLPFSEWSRFHIAPASVTRLRITDGRATLLGLSGEGGAFL